ncbi:branched chain amino acid ABC transporter substrate-binding protein (plasmid) [Paraburkholderia sp. PGU19]|uniref:branched-chain amino acid ABC transporter substrate-binding protein n=2 Tax=unclassified Paraburkholderia TaxID=2615204 RepID=UPI0015DB0938|nr:branched-chain amino acid ABC transporter substrate-binding protein [Paraburkholderia sp. PGU19]BCG04019.1 branched chain amino acid ABC transporter substrate-binding protein [Paraburkholderia sp. PGU19]
MKLLKSIIASSSAVVALASGVAHAQEDTVKLGFAGPLTGQNANLGKDVERGARMAVDDLNANPPVIGGKKVKIELQVEDDAGDPRQATQVAQRLVDAGVKGVVGHFNSGATIPASKIYFDNHIPEISQSSTNPKYTQQGFDTAFRLVANDGQLGAVLGKYAVQKWSARTVAVIDDRTAYGQGIADEFLKSAQASGAKLVSRQYTTDKATDFRGVLTAVKGENPDVVFYGGMDAQGGPMIKQMQQLGMQSKFMGGDGICTGELPSLAGAALQGRQVICAEAGGITSEYAAGMEDFRKRFKAKYGQDVVIYAPYAYDAVMILVDAMKRAGSSDPTKYLAYLKKTDYKGVIGETRFDSRGDLQNATLTLYTFNDGKRESLGVQH